MSRVRQIYASEGVFVGPAPASGYHFLDYSGNLNNNHSDTTNNYNLVQEINRIQGVSYGIDEDRVNIKQLGTQSLVARPIVNLPSIRLNIDYLVNSVANEAKMGFLVNYPEAAIDQRVCPINGFIDRTLTPDPNGLNYPFSYRDKRNIFIPLAREGEEVHGNSDANRINPKVTGYNVIAFGNCYLDAYSTEASVGSFPKSSTTWVCENISFHTSGSGCAIPAVDPRTRQGVQGKHFVIPGAIDETGLSVVLPGDIQIAISSTGNAGLNHFGFNFGDIKINSYAFGFSLNRQSLDTLGYKLPVDRRPTFPILVGLSFSAVVGENISGSFLNLMNEDKNYDISIQLLDRDCGGAGSPVVRYDFAGSLCKSISYDGSIGQNKVVSFGFESEIDPTTTGRGFFMSGVVNRNFGREALLLEDSSTDVLLLENPTDRMLIRSFAYF
jgi:hypothetical protein